MQIHVTEEARHLCFARHYLRKQVPKLGPVAAHRARDRRPARLGQMARLMLEISPDIVEDLRDPARRPARGLRQPRAPSRDARVADKVRALCDELGLVTPWTRPVWTAVGLAS